MKFVTTILALISFLMLEAQVTQSFSITSTTLFFNEFGEKLSLEDFAYITDKYPNAIVPRFKEDGSLEYITLKYPEFENANLKKNKNIHSENKGNTNTSKAYTNNYKSNATNYDSYSNVKELEGWSAPHFSILDANNNEFDTEKAFGTVIVLKFWFSKCIPCLEEIPELNKLARKYKNQNVSFYAPSVERKSATENFLRSNVFNYTTIYEAHKIAGLYKTPGYPTHVIIGKNGIIRKVIVGKRTNIYKVLDSEIERALLIQKDDADVVEFADNEYVPLNKDTKIFDKEGKEITQTEYIYMLNTGRYKIFKQIKKNGNINLLITQKN